MKNGPRMEWDGPDMTTVALDAFAGNRGLGWIAPRRDGVCDGMELLERCQASNEGRRSRSAIVQCESRTVHVAASTVLHGVETNGPLRRAVT